LSGGKKARKNKGGSDGLLNHMASPCERGGAIRNLILGWRKVSSPECDKRGVRDGEERGPEAVFIECAKRRKKQQNGKRTSFCALHVYEN